MNNVSQEIFQELDFFAASFLLGAVLVLAYDALRIFRQLAVHGTLWLAIEDFCYWVGTAIAIFAMLYQKNDGLIRGFAIGGVVMGMLMYYHLVSRHVVRYLVVFLKKIIYLVEKFAEFVTRPARKVVRTCVPKCLILKRKGRKLIKNLKKRLKKFIKEIKMGISK